MLKRAFSLMAILSFISALCYGDLAIVKKITGLDRPESFIYDPVSDSYFISCVGGSPSAKDNNGFIVRLSADLAKRTDKWAAGGAAYQLNAPKGMAVYKGVLYVSDIDCLRGFDIATGKNVTNYDFSKMGAKFLNDVASDDSGTVYISCTGSGRIFYYSVSQKAGGVFIEKGIFEAPNGILFLPEEKSLLIGDSDSGNLYKVKPVDKKPVKISEGFEGFDGIDLDSVGNFILSSFPAGKVWRLDKSGKVEVILQTDTTTADISVDRKHNYLLAPMMAADMAYIYKLK